MPEEESCFMCLGESTQEVPVQLFDFRAYRDIPCSCRVYCHDTCWIAYCEEKRGFECPICHSHVIYNVIIVSQHDFEEENPMITRESLFICICSLSVIISIIVLIIQVYHLKN